MGLSDIPVLKMCYTVHPASMIMNNTELFVCDSTAFIMFMAFIHIIIILDLMIWQCTIYFSWWLVQYLNLYKINLGNFAYKNINS